MPIALRQSDPAFSVVDKYYAAAKKEPTGGGSVDVARTDTFTANFLDLVRMLQSKQQATVVLVAHGGADGLIMPVTAKTNVSAEDSVLSDLVPLAASFPTLDAGKVTAFANNAGITEDEVGELAKACNAIQKHGSNCVEVHVRGCKIGKNSGNLDTLRKLFGSKKVTAPSCPMLYATFAPRWQMPALNVADWKSKNAAQTRRRDFTAGSSALVLDVDYGGSSASTQGAIQRISDLPTFATTMYGNSTHGQNQSMLIAAMWPDSDYFLPNESGYASQLVTSS
jgi:hypothetical protein